MAVNVSPIRRRQEGGGGVGKMIGTIGGGVVGAYFGGLPGATAGASLGGTVGGMAGDKVKKPQDSTIELKPAGGAMERRMAGEPQPQAYESKSPVLEQSLQALNEATPEQQEQYRQPLLKAYALSLRDDYRQGRA